MEYYIELMCVWSGRPSARASTTESTTPQHNVHQGVGDNSTRAPAQYTLFSNQYRACSPTLLKETGVLQDQEN